MRVGITYDLKADSPLEVGASDDLEEEFDSPATIEAIAGVLRDLGHDVEKLGDGRELLQKLLADPPDFVFNLAEGQGIGRSREARVPAVLEMLGLPYTGSDPFTLAVTLDKECAKKLVEKQVRVPWSLAVGAKARFPAIPPAKSYPFPLIVKPAWEGSSKGIRAKSLVQAPAQLPAVIDSLQRDYQQPLLVEEFIQGEELTVGVIGNNPPKLVGIMRVEPVHPTQQFVYGLETKRDFERLVRYECPAPLTAAGTEAVGRAALTVFRLLGCRDVARIDFRLREGIPYFLEVNPLPGLNPQSSDLVIMARLVGWSYRHLISTILQSALDRQ
jgi:D-alanine-D-alanine ligase